MHSSHQHPGNCWFLSLVFMRQSLPVSLISKGFIGSYFWTSRKPLQFFVNLWARFPVDFMNTRGFMQIFDFSQAFEPCDLVPSYELSKPPKVQMQTLLLIIAVSRLEQQPKFLPGENGLKQAQDCRNSRLLWWDTHIPIRATIGAQKEFLVSQVFVFLLQWNFFSLQFVFCGVRKLPAWCIAGLFFWNQQKNLGLHFVPTLYRDQERPLSSREEKCLWADKTACMENEYFVDQVQPANHATVHWWELGQSARIIINTSRKQLNTPGSYKSLKSYITAETPVLDSSPAAKG